jgi:hypothetical protein
MDNINTDKNIKIERVDGYWGKCIKVTGNFATGKEAIEAVKRLQEAVKRVLEEKKNPASNKVQLGEKRDIRETNLHPRYRGDRC